MSWNALRDLFGFPFVIVGSLLISLGTWLSGPRGKMAIQQAFEATFWESINVAVVKKPPAAEGGQ